MDCFTLPRRSPTAERPLLGLTVLMVEDSRFAGEALRLLCLRSGARIRRADCIAAARRHLRVYRPTVMVVDLGLPDGSGADLIAEMAASVPRVPVLLAVSGDASAATRARLAGADAFLPKPLTRLADFQQAVLARLPAEYQVVGPHRLSDVVVAPDAVALRDDLNHIALLLEDAPDAVTLEYVGQFAAGIARCAGDRDLERMAQGIGRRDGVARLRRMVAERITPARAL